MDKITFAEFIRAKGFSLADCKFFKLNALFPIMLGLAHATVALWCGSGLAAAVVAAVPVDDAKVPLFTIMFIPVYAILLDVDLARTQVWLTGLYVAVRAEIKSMRRVDHGLIPHRPRSWSRRALCIRRR